MPKRRPRINSNGRVTIPAAIRRQAGLMPSVEVDLVLDGEVIRVVGTDIVKAERRRALQAALVALAGDGDR